MTNISLLVVRHTFFKEVRFPLKGDHVHEVERIGFVVKFLIAERHQQTISNKLNVLTHKFSVHANEFDWQGV